jgi:tagatose-1,6-bisphosphate aldolase
MTAMTTAERRGYQQICDPSGCMMVIACDQRGGMRTLLATTPEEQAKIDNGILGNTKADIARYLMGTIDEVGPGGSSGEPERGAPASLLVER